jgi:hypothetical protein
MKKENLKLCEPCSGLGFDRHAFIASALHYPACRNCDGTGLLSAKKEKDYTLNAYADGFGVWHCEISFNYPGLGNTGEAERMAGKPKRLAYKVVNNESQLGSGRLLSLTIAEK